MIKNDKGQTVMLSIFFGIFIFLIGIVFINFLIPDVTTFRTGMDCSNSSGISSGSKLTCLFGDAVVPYWILLILSMAGGVILSRLTI